MLLNNINIWFFTTHNISHKKVELDCVWTIPLDTNNYTKEWGNILDVLLTYVTMTCNTQSHIKKARLCGDGDIIMHKLPTDSAVKAA